MKPILCTQNTCFSRYRMIFVLLTVPSLVCLAKATSKFYKLDIINYHCFWDFFQYMKLKILMLVCMDVYTYPVMSLFNTYIPLWIFCRWVLEHGTLIFPLVDGKLLENVWIVFDLVSLCVIKSLSPTRGMILEFYVTSLCLNLLCICKGKNV